MRAKAQRSFAAHRETVARRARLRASVPAIVALALLVLAPGGQAAQIPGGPPIAIFGPGGGGACALSSLASGTGDVSGASGSAKRTSGSNTLTNLTTSTGTFAIGMTITGNGIPNGTTISAVDTGAGTLTMSANATSGANATTDLSAGSLAVENVSVTCGTFAVGQLISGTGILPRTTITALGGGTITLSQLPLASGTGVQVYASMPFSGANSGFGGGSDPHSLAFDQATHRLFALDGAADTIHAFSSPGLGASIAGFPLSIDAGPGFSSDIAVDNTASPSPTAGRIYFADRNSSKVYAFGPAGNELTAPAFPGFPITIPPSPSPVESREPCGAAVDSAGNVWVGEEREHLIFKYSPAGDLLATIDDTANLASCDLAFDSNDDLFVAPDLNQSSANNRVYKLTAASNYAPGLATIAGRGNAGIAVDTSKHWLYAVNAGGSDSQNVVRAYSAEGELISEFATDLPPLSPSFVSVNRLAAVAVDQAAERVYVADKFGRTVYAFGTLTVPDAATGAPDVGTEDATLRGSVDPLSTAVTDCHFEYTTEADYELNRFEAALQAPCAQNPGSGSGAVPVEAPIGGLEPGTNYRFRLIAANANGHLPSASTPFITDGPQLKHETFIAGKTTATLKAQVNPNGEDTSYQFELVPEGQFEQNGYADATSVPAVPVGIGSGNSYLEVSQQATGLDPQTTYRFRVVASNASATVTGAGSAFTTLRYDGSDCPNADQRSGLDADLPDCRAYEQVSPIDKNGFDALDAPVLASHDGTAVAFASWGAFAGAKGSVVPNAYAASRQGGSWQTISLNPPNDPTQTLNGGGFHGAWDHFNKQLVMSPVVLAPGAVHGNDNVYLHDSLTGSYQLVATSEQPSDSFTQEPNNAGAEDGSRIYFTTDFSLPASPPAPAGSGPFLYEYSNGQLAYAGIYPDGSPAPRSARATHTDGLDKWSFGNMYRSVSADGRRVYWQDGANGTYLREDGQSTLVASGAEFWYASADGSLAYLTKPDGLYRYDAGSGQLVNLTPGADFTDQLAGVFGTSEDGSYVYFAAQMSPGAPLSLDVWHDGDVHLIAYIDNAGLDQFGEESFFVKLDPNSSLDSNDRSRAHWRVSANGRYFGFLFDGRLTGPNPVPLRPFAQAYLYDALSGNLACASCPPDGSEPTANVDLRGFFDYQFATGSFKSDSTGDSHNVSDAGQFFFQTAAALLPQDTNGKLDVYEYEGGKISLISTGQSEQDSIFGDASTSGDDVFFTTRQQLVGQDGDVLLDLYDARVGGGLASQEGRQSSAPCQGDACQGAFTRPPSGAGAGSSQFEGPGDPKPKPPTKRCPKGRHQAHRQGKTRCIKRHHRRAANHDRRAQR